jgi:hypothetical protein
MRHQLIHRQLLTELSSNNEGTKLIARSELSDNILISIAYRKLEAEGYLTFNYSGSNSYLGLP